MPTLLELCGIEIPSTVEGLPLFSNQTRKMLYGEIGEGPKATRMVTNGKFKLIYYPCGNVFQLFDTQADPQERCNLYGLPGYESSAQCLYDYLITHLHGNDLAWLKDGVLEGTPTPSFKRSPDYALFNQRGLHWPPPSGYSNTGKT